MFRRYRLSSTNKLDCPHAMGTDAFSPQRAELFRHSLLLPSPHSTPSRCSVAQGRLRLFTTDASRRLFESALERVRRSFRLKIYGYVVIPEHVHLLLSEPQHGTAPLKPRPGLSGPPVVFHGLSVLSSQFSGSRHSARDSARFRLPSFARLGGRGRLPLRGLW